MIISVAGTGYVGLSNIIIYEPTLKDDEFFKCKVIKDFDEFKKLSNVIITNRWDESLKDVKDKVYSRDLLKRD